MDSERSADLTCVGERMGHFIPTAIKISICGYSFLYGYNLPHVLSNRQDRVSIQTALSCSTDTVCKAEWLLQSMLLATKMRRALPSVLTA